MGGSRRAGSGWGKLCLMSYIKLFLEAGFADWDRDSWDRAWCLRLLCWRSGADFRFYSGSIWGGRIGGCGGSAAMSLGGILFALGPNSVFHGVMYALVPMVDKARVPAAGSIVFMLGLAPLAAFGMDRLALPDSAQVDTMGGVYSRGICGGADVWQSVLL